MAGGRFLQGMGQGAWTAAYGFIFNQALDGFFDPTIAQGLTSSPTTPPPTQQTYDGPMLAGINDPLLNAECAIEWSMAYPFILIVNVASGTLHRRFPSISDTTSS